MFSKKPVNPKQVTTARRAIGGLEKTRMVKAAKRTVRRYKGARGRQAKIRRRLDRIYPPQEKWGMRTWLQAFIWRNTPRIGMLKGEKPIKTSDYANFYRWTILKAAKEIIRPGRKGPVIIMVGGVGAVGKSTLSDRLLYTLNSIFSPTRIGLASIGLDGYFKPRVKEEVKEKYGEIKTISRIDGKVIPGEFDNPRASDLKKAIADLKALKRGETVKMTVRDVTTGEAIDRKIIGSKVDILVVDGLFTLHKPLAKLGDIRIGLAASLGQQLSGRVYRDMAPVWAGGRGRESLDVARKFVSRERFSRNFVISTFKNAHVILDRAAKPLGGPELGTWFLAIPGNPEFDFKFIPALKLETSNLLKEGRGKTEEKRGRRQR